MLKSSKFLKRTLMQWDLLGWYFLSNFDLDDNPIENNPNEKPSREESLINAFKQPVSKLYAMFIQSVIPVFDSFNNFLQNEEPFINPLDVFVAHYFQDWSYVKLAQNHMMW